MENNYYEVQITYNKNNYENLYNKLYFKEINNILEENGEIKIYFYENEKERINELKVFLLKDNIIKEKDFNILKLNYKNWNKEWENSIEALYIKDKIIIYPSWKKNQLKNIEGKILIEIDPKMSFGTGHSETTQLILELLSDYVEEKEQKMLDFGCGTGVLSIAAIKLGVKEAIAIDIDDDSIRDAEEYFEINSVKDKITLLKTNISNLNISDFDIICANIICHVIIDNINSIKDKLKINGKLFLSGILNPEAVVITDLLKQNNFEIVELRNKSDWVGVYAVKR